MEKIDLLQLVDRLVDVRLIDARILKQCKKAGQVDGSGLCQMLAERSKQFTVGQIDRICRGDAPMAWKDASGEEDVKFKEQVLPPARLLDLQQSRVQGLSTSAPKVGTNTGPPQAGALQNAKADGGAAHTQTVLPAIAVRFAGSSIAISIHQFPLADEINRASPRTQSAFWKPCKNIPSRFWGRRANSRRHFLSWPAKTPLNWKAPIHFPKPGHGQR